MLFLSSEGGAKNPLNILYVVPGGEQPYQFSFTAKIFHTGKISSVKAGSDKDEISVKMLSDDKQADVCKISISFCCSTKP